MERQDGGRSDQGMVVRSATSALDFLRRIFARLASYCIRVRRFFVFEVAKNGSLGVKEEERGALENKVEDGLVEVSTVLAEIIVTSPKEATDQDVEICDDDCATKNIDEEELHLAPALACMVVSEDAPEEQQQEPQIQSVACESVSVIFPADCTVTSEKDEEEVVDNSRKRHFLERKSSIKELNAVVAGQLTKCLLALERSMVHNKTDHRRAIILATLVAIAVWARNAKHLHQSLPRLTRGAHINVHFRSRL